MMGYFKSRKKKAYDKRIANYRKKIEETIDFNNNSQWKNCNNGESDFFKLERREAYISIPFPEGKEIFSVADLDKLMESDNNVWLQFGKITTKKCSITDIECYSQGDCRICNRSFDYRTDKIQKKA